MKKPTLIQSLTPLIVLLLFITLAMTASAQNYYPAEIGNEWILVSTDGMKRLTYSLEVPEEDDDSDHILLKIVTENLNNGKVIDTDKYFLTEGPDEIKLHKTILQQKIGQLSETVTASFKSPATFFPKELQKGITWNIVADIEILKLPVKSTTNIEVIEIEDITTSVGTFRNCVKVKFFLSLSGLLTLESTSYQWLAPNVGPVKFQNTDGDVYEITSFKRSPPPVIEAQNPPVWSLQSNTFTVTGTRLGGILNAKILEDVEDHVSEQDKLLNLGIVSVTGNIVPPGDGTGLATNLARKQDLWVAGRIENAPIIGTITLFAENSKGRTEETITVTINISQ